jgi:hypothetical protein
MRSDQPKKQESGKPPLSRHLLYLIAADAVNSFVDEEFFTSGAASSQT